MIEHLIFGLVIVVMISLLLAFGSPLWITSLCVVAATVVFYLVTRRRKE